VFTESDLAVYREAMLRPGASRATIDYYRQALRQGSRALPSTPINVPTLVLWGLDDPVLQPGMNERLGAWVADLRYVPIPGCGHWTQQEQPEIVNQELLRWLRAHP
jgi:pimeloyl-ACP methyl ester carboxylesterase